MRADARVQIWPVTLHCMSSSPSLTHFPVYLRLYFQYTAMKKQSVHLLVHDSLYQFMTGALLTLNQSGKRWSSNAYTQKRLTLTSLCSWSRFPAGCFPLCLVARWCTPPPCTAHDLTTRSPAAPPGQGEDNFTSRSGQHFLIKSKKNPVFCFCHIAKQNVFNCGGIRGIFNPRLNELYHRNALRYTDLINILR